ncbi:STAS domain-containing protein [Streptomyces bauhiniae]|uniref:STAS domain-containing protein n=1 Tax=Streptomyces bauhiniae TaxID=2340725 RepID=A0A7K3QN44_9ACTN|nr:STAS domain-containing protein [Streptomyces bauhiniae]NEB91306.1 STAS domain-containing protein [Streptomyces bauhiniae]
MYSQQQHDGGGTGVSASAQRGSVWVVELRGELDLAFIDDVERATADVLRMFPGPLVYDLRHLSFADSLLVNHLLITRRQRPVGLIGTNRYLDRMLEVTGTSEVLPVFASPEAAEAGLTRAG